MSFDQAPPRLRTLRGDLPRELTLVLEDTYADDASRAELDALEQRVKQALPRTVRARSALPPARRSRVAAVVFTFALGAAAGVAGSSAVFYVISPSAPKSQASSAPSQQAQQTRRGLVPAQSAEPRRTPELPVDDDATPAAAPAPRESARSPVKNPVSEPALEPSTRPAAGSREEFALLARAQAALTTNPGSALALTSDHERNFPNGALLQERELVAIDALLRLGRRAEASARAARFHQQFPTSVHGRRIDVLLGTADSSAGHR